MRLGSYLILDAKNVPGMLRNGAKQCFLRGLLGIFFIFQSR
jgi:hypothetical protein